MPGPGIIEGSEDSLSIEDLLIERLINLALQLDQEAAQKKDNPQSLENRLARSGLSKVYFLKPNAAPEHLEGITQCFKNGCSLFSKGLIRKRPVWLSFGEKVPCVKPFPGRGRGPAVERGTILILLSFDEYVFLSRQIIIQSFLEDFSGKGNITYLRVEDPTGKIIAQTGEKFFEAPARKHGEDRNPRLQPFLD